MRRLFTLVRDAIKNEALTRAAEAIETTRDITAEESRLRIKEAIDERYTAPSDAPTSA
ncbi:MAG TPA: hypothetical protein VNN62_07775 [Methylomirabilota bacterium]|jgi:hypothetical protein|nr:hypothetical protein [Methylomirabilota bacterium]